MTAQPMLRMACLIAAAGTAHGAIANLRLVGTTNTQAVLSYTAPDAAACTVEVSENPGYSPLVHDVNGAYFAGSQLDSRSSGITRGRERSVVIGTRTIERASSGVAYSRALQAATTHYYRITCGADQAAGTFQTASIPFGDTHGDPPILDAAKPGQPMRISPSFARNSTWIDPHTGALIKRIQQPQDHNVFMQTNDRVFTTVIEATNWTNPNNALSATDAGAAATYNGASCSGPSTCDWLKLRANFTLGASYEQRIDVIRISVNGSRSDANAANRGLVICPVAQDDSIDAEGVCKTITLPQSTAKVTNTPSGIQDTWRAPGKREWTHVQVSGWGNVRFAIRPENNVGTTTIDAVRWDLWESGTGNVGTGGAHVRCNDNPRNDNDGERYLCTSFNASDAGNLYSIHATTGDVRFLGVLFRSGTNRIVQDNFLWSSTDPNVLYGAGASEPDNYTITYTGAGTEVAAGTSASFSSVAIHPGGELLGPAIQTFTTAHSAQYGGRIMDTAKYNCYFDSVQGDYLMATCRGAAQDTYGWLAVYKISTNAIIGAQPLFAAPTCRWCVIHSREPIGPQPVSMVTPSYAKNQLAGNGIYKSALVSGINSTDTSITVTSTCGGDATCAAWNEGEPVATVGDDYMQDAEVGDVAFIESECVRITAKTDHTHWTIQRGVNLDGCGTAASHASGKTLNFTTANKPGAGATSYGNLFSVIWDFLGDPYGMDATGTYAWPVLYSGHMASRGNVIVGNKSVALGAEGTNIMATVKDPAYTYSQPEAPWFAGKYPPGPGNTYQQHPNVAQVKAGVTERRFFYDIRPFVGGNIVTPSTPGCNPDGAIHPAANGCAAKRVSGLTNVYQMSVTDGTSNTDGMNPKHLALFGIAGLNLLRDISGPGSVLDDSAGKNYTICYALLSNECVTGSSAGQLYVQVPGLTDFYCTGAGYATGDICPTESMSTGSTLGQFGFVDRNKEGIDPALLSNVNNIGTGWTRRLSMHGFNIFPRLTSVFTTGKPLPNGKWVIAVDWIEQPDIGGRGLLSMVKVPAIVKDSVNRSTFVPGLVKIPSLPKGTDNIVVEFGYGEHGRPDQFRCTSRAEVCVAASAALNEATPFYYAASEAYSGVSCANGCAVTLALYPGRVAYYRVKYRDAANNVLFAGPMEVIVGR